MPTSAQERRLAWAAALAGLLLSACGTSTPTLLPPPFGPNPDAKQPARLFFPTGLAVHPTGIVLVANSNFDHAFDAGTIVSLQAAPLRALFQGPAPDPRQLPPDPLPFDPAVHLADVAMIGGYAGPLAFDSANITAYTGSRDSNRLNAVALDPATGRLRCRTGPGSTPGPDCRAGVVDLLKSAKLEGPFGIAAGTAAGRDAIFVSALIPHIDIIQGGNAFTTSPVAALDAGDPSQLLFSISATTPTLAAGVGAGPMVFDKARRQLVLGGCYQRFPNATQGEPSSAKCLLGSSNVLRFLSVDAGSSAQPRIVEIGSQVRGTETSGLALADEDPLTQTPPRTLYATTRNPDLLAEFELPSDPAMTPFLRRATPLPSLPSQILPIQPPPGAPPTQLVAVTVGSPGSVAVFDARLGRIVGQVDRLGDTPFALAQLPPRATDGSAQLIATIFGDCRLALVEVSYAEPWKAVLRARLGSCP